MSNKEESSSLLDRQPTFPSPQRLVPPVNKNIDPDGNHIEDLDTQNNHDEMPKEGYTNQNVIIFTDTSNKVCYELI